MNEYFYWFGFACIANIVYYIIHLILNPKLEIVEMVSIADAQEQGLKTNWSMFVAGWIVLVWMIFGYVLDTPEKIYFLLAIIIAIAQLVTPLIIGTILGYYLGKNQAMQEAGIISELPTLRVNLRAYSFITALAEIAIISFIIYSHYSD